MVSQELIDEQLNQERLQIHLGEKSLADNTIKSEQRAYASSSLYGIHSIQELIPCVEKAIIDIHERIHTRQNGLAFKEIKEYLLDIEPLVAAGITCKIVFDKVFSYKDEDDNLLANVADAVGTAIMQECQMRFYLREAPGLLHTLKQNYWHKACGTQQKLTNIKLAMNKADIRWKPWHRSLRVKLGGILIDTVLSTSGWFKPLNWRKGTKTQTLLVPTELFHDLKDQIMNQAELFSAEQWVMLIPPRDWTQDSTGGYLLDEVMRGHQLVRRGNTARIQGEKPIQFLNKIQKVSYCLNPFMVEVAELLYERGYIVGKKDPKFIPTSATEPLPPKPVDIETNANARKKYCQAAAQVHNRNHNLARKSCRTRMTMQAVARFKDKDRFYIPHSFDYRGRVYPIPAFLTQQDTDFGKSLLKFAESSFMTDEAEEWLAFQVATTYGLDKAPIKERIEWAKANESFISLIAKDPIGRLSDWESADEPWQFLAACDEYYHCVIECDRHFTSLPVATDATCSGLQILAGLARDKSTAKLVNVLPGDRPQDAYKAVAELARPNCPAKWQEHIDRGVAKRLVMTIPYNAKFKSNWNYVNLALNDKEKGKGLDVPKEDVTAITHALRDAVYTLFPGPTKVMAWIEEVVAEALSKGKTELEWTTPSGFIVSQKIMKPEVIRMDLQLLGKVKKVTVATGDSTEVHVSKHKAATSPNLIHSLDASLLHLAALNFDAPVGLIHDSVLCRATDMSTLSSIVRKTYMHLFAEHNYLEDWAKQIGTDSKPPIVGDLEPESVIESTYFFC